MHHIMHNVEKEIEKRKRAFHRAAEEAEHAFGAGMLRKRKTDEDEDYD